MSHMPVKINNSGVHGVCTKGIACNIITCILHYIQGPVPNTSYFGESCVNSFIDCITPLICIIDCFHAASVHTPFLHMVK